MAKKIDVFAHVLPPRFRAQMVAKVPDVLERYPFMQHPLLSDFTLRKQHVRPDELQVISNVNLNPEDYFGPKEAARLCRELNDELSELVTTHPELFYRAVGAVPLNNMKATKEILAEIATAKELCGAQIFTRALGKSIADESYEELFATAAKLHLPLWLHPIFDQRKPDNNIIFSWEYELSQAMLEIVQAGLLTKYPELKIIVHHAGGMVPYFAGRIEHILPTEQANAFKAFYVDTALLGNKKALELAVAYYGEKHVLYGTDAPLGIAPAGAGRAIQQALVAADISSAQLEQIYFKNFERILAKK